MDNNVDLLTGNSLLAGFIGFLGSAISLQFITDLTIKEKLLMIFSGVVMSIIFTPPVIEFFTVSSTFSYAVAFLIGFFGWAISGGVLKSIQSGDWWLVVREIITKVLGRR